MSETLNPVGVTGLLAAVPYLLGYRPDEALVIVVLQETRVVLTMCVSLEGLPELLPVEKAELAIKQAHGTAIIMIGYSHDLDDELAETLKGLALEIEAAQLKTNPISVHDVVQVGAGRWRSLLDTDQPENGDYAEVLNDPINAEAVLQGRCPARTRSEIAQRVRPGSQKPDPAFSSTLREVLEVIATKDHETIIRDISVLLSDCVSADGQPDPRSFGHLVALAAHPASLGTSLSYITMETAERWVEIWSTAARCTTGLVAFAPLVLAGIAAWIRGDGVLTNVCGDLASEINPDHFGVRLLRRVTDLCLPPESWESFRAGLQLSSTNAE